MDVSTLIAVASLAVSIYALYVQKRDRRPRLVVRVEYANKFSRLYLTVHNSGQVRVQVTEMLILITPPDFVLLLRRPKLWRRRGNPIAGPGFVLKAKCPYWLEPGEQYHKIFRFTQKEITVLHSDPSAGFHANVIIYDGSDRPYISNRFDLDELAPVDQFELEQQGRSDD